MGDKISIKCGGVEVVAELNDSKTAQVIRSALPVRARANTWGDEIYFSIPVDIDPEDPREVVDMGDIAYWPPGSAFCIFFGPTPASRGNEIRPASPVNVVGNLLGDPKEFRKVHHGEKVIIEKVE